MAAIKTQGYKRRNADASEEFRPSCDPQEVPLPWMAATLVQHNGPHERVFTESEVRAMLMRVDKAGRKAFSAEQVKLLRAEGFEVETDVPFSDPA